jgi:hypothetical protein
VGGWLSLVLTASVVAALITGSINLWLARQRSREEERARVRSTFAAAYQAYADYKEMPFAVRRRDAAKPADERLRLSETLRAVQSRLSYYESWTMLESPSAGNAYSAMVKQLRVVAGGAMRAGWDEPGLSDDVGMNIPPAIIDLSSLLPYESAYREAVAAHLDEVAPRWAANRRSPPARMAADL